MKGYTSSWIMIFEPYLVVTWFFTTKCNQPMSVNSVHRAMLSRLATPKWNLWLSVEGSLHRITFLDIILMKYVWGTKVIQYKILKVIKGYAMSKRVHSNCTKTSLFQLFYWRIGIINVHAKHKVSKSLLIYVVFTQICPY